MAVDRVLMIASNPATVARLAQQIARAGMAIDAWSYRGSPLAYSRYLRQHRDLARNGRDRGRQLREIADSVHAHDWVILGTDHDVYEISNLLEGGAPVRALLPVARNHGALRDKAAMATTLEQLGVGQPAWTVAAAATDVESAVARVGGRAMVKTFRGWGGLGVTEVDDAKGVPPLYGDGPYLVQQWVDGETMSIDLVAVDGRVALAPYSDLAALTSPFGVSCARHYRPIDDNGLWADLDRLAAGFGGTWLANVTAIRRSDGTHTIIEVDVRPNAWHAYLARLGFPMAGVLAAIRDGAAAPFHAGSTTPNERVVNVTRTVTSARQGNPGHVRLLLDTKATWKYANRGDAGLTLRELRRLARELVVSR
jgi:hypothetical protein